MTNVTFIAHECIVGQFVKFVLKPQTANCMECKIIPDLSVIKGKVYMNCSLGPRCSVRIRGSV